MRKVTIVLLAIGLTAGCTPQGSTDVIASTSPSGAGSTSVRLLFVGDLMVGRKVAPVAEAEGPGLFEDVRYLVSSADLALANLESPLTNQPHLSDNPNALEADPALASLIAGAGFDLMAVANNHAGDAGDDGLRDTLASLSDVDITPLGAGLTRHEAERVVVVDRNGVRIAFLAFDLTGQGPTGGPDEPGVAVYTSDGARRAVEAAQAEADVVMVSIHGGIEYLLDPDPVMAAAASELTAWGADVVWGHGSHVAQPPSLSGRAVVATGLGNFLFDQQSATTESGLVLEVLATANGVAAYRVGHSNHADLRPRFLGWDQPSGAAVLIGTEWWNVTSPVGIEPSTPVPAEGFPWGDVTTAARGDATGDGGDLLVVSYRHPFRPTEANELFPGHDFADETGRSAHFGLFDPETFDPVWASGTMPAPVARLAVCDGAVAVAFDHLDDPDIVSTGAWSWWDFGFTAADLLPGSGTPACADVDRDGRTEPVILDR